MRRSRWDQESTEKSNTIIEWPRRGRPTGKLNGWVPVERSLTVGCGHQCGSCGRCHTPGCRSCAVVCAEAQQALMRRDEVPVDRPKRRWWRLR